MDQFSMHVFGESPNKFLIESKIDCVENSINGHIDLLFEELDYQIKQSLTNSEVMYHGSPIGHNKIGVDVLTISFRIKKNHSLVVNDLLRIRFKNRNNEVLFDKFGLIIHSPKIEIIVVKVYQQDYDVSGLSDFINESSLYDWDIQFLLSVATSSREYRGLKMIGSSFKGYFVGDSEEIRSLSAAPLEPKFTISDQLTEIIAKELNEDQLRALLSVLETKEGLSVIIGPPGTGKTRTIVFMLSVLTNFFKKNILVSGPSNEAVDNIMIALLKIGLINESGERYDPSNFICRIGDTKNKILKQFTPTELIQREYNANMKDQQSDIYKKAKKIDNFNERIKDLEKELTKLNYINNRSREESSRLLKINRDLDSLDYELEKATKKLNYYQRSLQDSVLKGKITFATLSGCGSACLNIKNFDMVVIDEAGQATKGSTAVALSKTNKAVLIGDDKQLPPTVISPWAQEKGYSESLFRYVLKNRIRHRMLTIQYRMHPLIANISSNLFYDGKLINGKNVGEYSLDLYRDDSGIFGPAVFIDIADSFEQTNRLGSVSNYDEEYGISLLIDQMFSKYPSSRELSIAIISPYSEQIANLNHRFQDYHNVSILTTDSSQGKEYDIVIYSCTRGLKIGAGKKNSIGFLANKERMNVGITRAKYSLIMFGNATVLNTNEYWRNLINSFKKLEKGFIKTNTNTIKNGALINYHQNTRPSNKRNNNSERWDNNSNGISSSGQQRWNYNRYDRDGVISDHQRWNHSRYDRDDRDDRDGVGGDRQIPDHNRYDKDGQKWDNRSQYRNDERWDHQNSFNNKKYKRDYKY